MRTLRYGKTRLPLRGWHVSLAYDYGGVAVACPCCRRLSDTAFLLEHEWATPSSVRACQRCASRLTRRRHEVRTLVRRLAARREDRADWIAEGWKTSGKGNLTRPAKGQYVTVFRCDAFQARRTVWKACVDGVFSHAFDTAEDAMAHAFDKLYPATALRPSQAWMAARPY